MMVKRNRNNRTVTPPVTTQSKNTQVNELQAMIQITTTVKEAPPVKGNKQKDGTEEVQETAGDKKEEE